MELRSERISLARASRPRMKWMLKQTCVAVGRELQVSRARTTVHTHARERRTREGQSDVLYEDHGMNGQRVQGYRARYLCQDPKGRTGKGLLHEERIDSARAHRLAGSAGRSGGW